MFTLLLLLQAAVAPSSGPVTADPPRADWVSKPDASYLMRCASSIRAKPAEAHVTMLCATAPQDHIKECVVVSNTGAPDVRFERAALCATKYFRMRASGPDGHPVMDVPVNVPFGFVSSSTYAGMAKAPRRIPPPGTVDEAVIVIDWGNLW